MQHGIGKYISSRIELCNDSRFRMWQASLCQAWSLSHGHARIYMLELKDVREV